MIKYMQLMKKTNQKLESFEGPTDTDMIDLEEEDTVIEDDVLEENSSSEKDPYPTKVQVQGVQSERDSPEDESSTIELDAAKTITHPEEVALTSEKTIADAIEEAQSLSETSLQVDPETEAAIDDIVREESDDALVEVDARIAAVNSEQGRRSFKEKVVAYAAGWWNNRPVRYGTLVVLLLLVLITTLLPASRYAVLNTLGVRVSSSMIVVDSQTRLPLKNISVVLQEQTASTDEEGEISFNRLKLGKSSLVISKRGYADIQQTIVLGWGSNPIGEQALIATGEQFTFVLRDWKSKEAITAAEATAGENSARADENGKIILTVGEKNIANVEVTITATNYRNEFITSDDLLEKSLEVDLVPAKKHAFVSTRDGKYDLYTIDVDGKNERLLLKATGSEREVPVITIHPTKDVLAYTSSRSGETNRDGFVLDGLFIIDALSGEQRRIARSEQLQVIGWSGDSVVFLQVVEGTSRGNSERSKLMSFNYLTGERTELAAANYFNDVKIIQGMLYYAVSSFAVPESMAKLYMVGIDGNNRTKIIDYQVWNIFRTAYDTVLFSAADQRWFKKVGDSPIEEAPQQTSVSSKNFVDSPNGERTLWVEIRDGKGVLLKSDTDVFSEEQVVVMPGLFDILYWTNDATVVLRVIKADETADYVLNIDAGEMQKITDVTATRNTYF
jgi:hypothetical protein